MDDTRIETIVLPKMITPSRPLNIAADPRVFRGSVIAKQREALRQIYQEMEERETEERWRADAVKNKLDFALGVAGLMGGDHAALPSEVPLGHRIARLNAMVGRRRAIDIAMGRLPSIDSHRSIDAKISPTGTTVGDAAKKRRGTATSHPSAPASHPLAPASRQGTAHLKHSASVGSLLPELKSKDDFIVVDGQYKSVRFLPPRVRASRHPRLTAKFMPLSGKTEPTPFNVQQPYDSRFPRRNIAGDVGLSTRRSGAIKQKPPLRRANQGISASFGGSNKLSSKHRKQWETLPEVTDPPPTAVGRLFWAHQGCQTDDFLAFKEALEPLVKEMVNGAILDAQRFLVEQDELQKREEQNKELLRIVVSEKQRNTELLQNIQQQTEIQKDLEEKKTSFERALGAMEHAKFVSDVVQKMTDNCVNRLMDRAIIKDDRFRKDIAADTRQFEQDTKNIQKIIDEVENDFFPYIYQKAERAFVHALADSFLKDALFSNNDQFREEAYQKLNDKILEYNRMLKRVKPGQATEELKRLVSRSSNDSPPLNILDEIL